MLNISLPDGSVRSVEEGTSALQLAAQISEGLARNVLAAEVNGNVVDASRPLPENATVKLLTWNDDNGKSTLWHSSAHLMAEALESLYPGIKLAIGPPIENGFYYDVDFEGKAFTQEDFSKVEKLMLELARQKNEFVRKEVSKADAISHFTEKGDQYKLELIEGLEDGEITFYTQGNFTDLCRGPHIPNTGFIKAVKLMNVAGAYWRGDEKNKMLTRVYAITFPKAAELEEYLVQLEEAKKRDHRKLGKELGLFHFSQKVGSGLPLWLPKGTDLRTRLQNFLTVAQKKAGYQPVITPHIGSKELYETSGHWAKYGADSFQPIHTPQEGEMYMLKPMNCPHHCEIYNAEPRSYKDLPLRFSEFGTVYRYEQTGELHGLTRVRGFTQDDAHIFCMQDQVKEEIGKVIDLVLYIFKTLNFQDFLAQVSLRDPINREKYIGTEENWEKAELAIQEVANEKGLRTVVEYGEAAFYGPKLDFMVRDAIGRKWQLGTVQLDYNLPERFQLEYTGADNQKHRPVMIHRAPFGSMERFVAILIEHCAGQFPLWLTPEQVRILPVSEKYNEYAKKVANTLEISDIRALVDDTNEKVGKKIREAELAKVTYMLVVGENEMLANSVSARKKGEGDLGVFSIEDFATMVNDEVASMLKEI
ncbi:MAG: threonine--tRNA ligase [Flavobacteriales bacterium]|nr:threonine--tRNA ligase [Flavobacteriales bacterium]MDP4716153.1 threonine--tRNA ligase [Flavobacteriales bacterium]MDP4732288.1 threonine--tRNA ligase [Flavobacteriales bacterium]MDP4818493.1 threonine--tRNA ligase [Flavobacteriales bacterium]MDP4950846.1 threonine--tRNA ligase [Flavobacteriales bacterium]